MAAAREVMRDTFAVVARLSLTQNTLLSKDVWESRPSGVQMLVWSCRLFSVGLGVKMYGRLAGNPCCLWRFSSECLDSLLRQRVGTITRSRRAVYVVAYAWIVST